MYPTQNVHCTSHVLAKNAVILAYLSNVQPLQSVELTIIEQFVSALRLLREIHILHVLNVSTLV